MNIQIRQFGFKISPLYQYIHEFDKLTAPSGAGDANCFKPLYDQFLIYLIKFMEAYQAQEKEE